MAWTAPRTWVAGETVTAALLNTHIRDNLKAIGDPWTAFTPTLTAATVNPTLGTGSTTSGWYMQAGKYVAARIRIAFGSSGVAAGTGAYRIALPVAAQNSVFTLAGAAYCFDSSAGALATPVPHFNGTTLMDLLYPATWPSGTLTTVGAAAPWTWAASDEINVSIVYEAA